MEKKRIVNESGEIKEVYVQPERSKREDLIDFLLDELIERHKLSIENCKAQLGCGALNSMET